MNIISSKMILMLERLAEMFPSSNYQTRLDAYLKTKSITDCATLEHYLNEFDRSQKEYFI